MKGRVAVALLVVVMAVAVGVVIGVVSSGGEGPKNQPDPANVISVSGGASVTSAPDEAVVSLGVKSEADNALDAQQTNAQKATDVMKALQSAGVAKEDIQTTNIRLDKHYQDRGTNHETVTYVADNEMDVTVHDLTKVGDITDKAIAAGANVVGGIEFRLSNQSTAKNDALKKAIEAARSKAQTLAVAAGATLGPVVRIDEDSSNTRPYIQRGYDSMASLGALPAPFTPVSPQDVETEVNVSVVYELNAG